MAEVLLFHHALGQRPGFFAFADALRRSGHLAYAPDLYEGQVFAELDEGIAHGEETGFDAVLEPGAPAADPLPKGLVYPGLSLEVLPAQMLAQTRPQARGALLLHASVPTGELAGELAGEIGGAELFLCPGSGHLFADSSTTDYDHRAASLLEARVLAILDRLR